jgi:hypothetical protein
MAEPTKEPKLIDDRSTNSAVKSNMDMIAEAAKSFRRVRGDEAYDAKGLRTIWHQGKLRTELLTWESKRGLIVRQELSFFSNVVDFREGKPLITGRLKHGDVDTDTGAPRSNQIEPDPKPVRVTLEYASHLLRNVPDRDYYAQHFLKQVNDALNAEFDDESHTVISTLESYPKEDSDPQGRTLVSGNATIRLDEQRPRPHTRAVAFVLLILAGLVLGVGIGLLLW